MTIRNLWADPRTGRYMEVEILRLGVRTLHSTCLLHLTIIEVPGDYDHFDAVLRSESRNALGLDIVVTSVAHFRFARQVQPQLEAAHHPFFLLRHLAMDHPTRCGHPLHAAALQQANVAHVVFVAHAAFKHVGHGLETAMRVRWETGDVVVRFVRAEFVEHQEGIEQLDTWAAEDARQLDARAVRGRLSGLDR